MATTQETIDYILDQIEGAGELRVQKMFGEYALYCDGKVVAFVCDDTLFIKITPEGRGFAADHYQEGQAYPGSKLYMQIPEEMIDDRQWLSELVRITADALPMPKPKVKKVKKSQKR